MIKVLAISGSLRQQSYNTALLRAVQALAPQDWQVDIHVPKGYPVYDDDERQQGWPEAVQALEKAVRAADCVLIATPEYNYSIPGGLKNVIDWVSRLPDQPFKDKLVGIMGVSAGRLGAVRGQIHLRQCFQFLDSQVLSRPEVIVGNAAQVFQNGELTDDGTKDAVRAFIDALDQRLRVTVQA